MDAHFRWFEGEKAQFRFVPYDWAFLFVESDGGTGRRRWRRRVRTRLILEALARWVGSSGVGEGALKLPGDILREHTDKKTGPDLEERMVGIDQAGGTDQPRCQQYEGQVETGGVFILEGEKEKRTSWRRPSRSHAC